MKTLFVATALLACSWPAWSGPDLDAAAADACACLKAPYEQVEKAMQLIRAAQASGDMSGLMAAQGEMMQVMNASGECFNGLVKKYPEIDKSDALKEQVMAKTEKRCPNPATAMMSPQ